MIGKGITSAISSVKDAVSNVAGTISSFLGFHSPTEQGPGADADTWAPNLIKMFAVGITGGTSAISSASSSLMQSLRSSMTAAPVMSMAGTGGYGSNGGDSSTSSQSNALLQAITGLTAALSKTAQGGTGGTTPAYNQNAPLMHIANMTVRNDSDLQQQQRMLYNSQQSTLRALGIR